tara:strand:- start:164 stop:1714 length:1551 start_codon:yes stop_codon:yes gene_type:complete
MLKKKQNVRNRYTTTPLAEVMVADEEFIDMVGQPRRELERELALNYNLEQVVADLVDNSIDAGAENVWVIYNEEEYNNRNSFFVAVIDDGKGIPDNKISSVMDFGAPREYDELELGKFGVGMKSSSLSQAREVTLLSKTEGSSINLRRLSSEVVIEKDAWTLIPKLRDHMHTEAISLAKRSIAELESGSAVVLEDMHKLKHRIGDGERESYLTDEYGHIKDYLGLVFERYIEGTALQRENGSKEFRKVNIFFNGKSEAHKIEKLDPFLREMKDGTSTGTLSKTIPMTLDDGNKIHKIELNIWITPNDTDRGQDYDARMKNAARDSGISELQGIYFYRNERLIDFPGWKKIVKHEPHATCVRWEMHFPPSLDDIFQLDPSKREIQLPRILFDQMTKISRTAFKWHMDDSKSINHRARAKIRQGGKDKPQTIAPPSTPPATPSPTPGATTGSTGSTGTPSKPDAWSARALTKVSIKKLEGSITGHLFVSERTDGDSLQITLNTKHGLYKAFIDAMKKE